MAQGHRPDRVGEQIRDELSELLSRGVVHDPGIGFITLTRVQVSPDLQLARVFYTSLGDPKARRETARALDARDAVPAPADRRPRCGCGGFPSSSSGSTSRSQHQDRIEQILRDLHEEEAQRAARRRRIRRRIRRTGLP